MYQRTSLSNVELAIPFARLWLPLFAWVVGLGFLPDSVQGQSPGSVPVIIDTDMGNDIDDVFALGMLHALQDRGECKILAVTVSKNHPFAGPWCDVLNTFYGHGSIPIGVLKSEKQSDDGPYLAKVMAPLPEGTPTFPHRLRESGEAPSSVAVLRKALAEQGDGTVVVLAIGPLTNMSYLLDSPPDAISPLAGRDLIAKKVSRLVAMAGDFSQAKAEFNVFTDAVAARNVLGHWASELVLCPFEMGMAYHYPEASLEHDFRYTKRHPLLEADRATFGKANGFPAWDLIATLEAIRPEHGYFRRSNWGTITLDADLVTHHNVGEAGKHRYLLPSGHEERVREVISALASQPPLSHDQPPMPLRDAP